MGWFVLVLHLTGATNDQAVNEIIVSTTGAEGRRDPSIARCIASGSCLAPATLMSASKDSGDSFIYGPGHGGDSCFIWQTGSRVGQSYLSNV